jgi:hypothetical protein
MTAPYKKRAKAGWSSDKKESNRSERSYEEVEISEQVVETTKVGSNKKPKLSWKERQVKNMLSDLKYAFKLSKGNIEDLNKHTDSWSGSWRQSYYQKCKKYLPMIKNTVKDEDLSNKVKKQMNEVLDCFGEKE